MGVKVSASYWRKRNSNAVELANGVEEVDSTPIAKWRCFLPQVIACMTFNMMLFVVGLGAGFATIAIPAFRGLQPEKYPNETIQLTAEESSWFGGLVFLTEPLGSLISGWITEQIGRKRSMYIAAIPPITAWIILYFAQTTTLLFVAGVLLGLAAGLLGAPIYTYCGEVTQPQIRGVMLMITNLSTMTGISIMLLLGSITTWRNASLVGAVLPILIMIVMRFIPESPQWLIAQNRPADAHNALRWLRGWTSAKAVIAELNDMTTFIAQVNACALCQRDKDAPGKCTHKSGYFEKVKELKRTKSLRPLALLLFCMCVTHSSGSSAIRPFLVQIFVTFRIPMDSNWGSVLMGLVDIMSNVFCVFAIPIVGKRVIMLTGLTGVVIFCFGVAINAYMFLSFDTSSFNIVSVEEPTDNPYALALFICLGVCASMAGCVPWMMNSEVYPFRIRGTATGITSAFGYITMFIATKTYLNFENTLTIAGSFVLYACLTLFGLCVLFKILPNTEGHTLEEIEHFFSDKMRKLTDWQIKPIARVTVIADDPISAVCNPSFVHKD